MATKSDWKDVTLEKIVEDLMEIKKHKEIYQSQKLVFPEWAKKYAIQFGLIENKDFIVTKSYMEVCKWQQKNIYHW